MINYLKNVIAPLLVKLANIVSITLVIALYVTYLVEGYDIVTTTFCFTLLLSIFIPWNSMSIDFIKVSIFTVTSIFFLTFKIIQFFLMGPIMISNSQVWGILLLLIYIIGISFAIIQMRRYDYIKAELLNQKDSYSMFVIISSSKLFQTLKTFIVLVCVFFLSLLYDILSTMHSTLIMYNWYWKIMRLCYVIYNFFADTIICGEIPIYRVYFHLLFWSSRLHVHLPPVILIVELLFYGQIYIFKLSLIVAFFTSIILRIGRFWANFYYYFLKTEKKRTL